MRRIAAYPMLLLILFCSCQDNENELSLREEYVNVYLGDSKLAVDYIQIPFEGVTDGVIHIKTNVDLEMNYNSGASGNWLTIKDVQDVEEGHSIITYDAASMVEEGSLDRRQGYLRFVAPSLYFGKFIDVRQGYEQVWNETFEGYSGSCYPLSGNSVWTSDALDVLGTHFYDYVSFNAWYESSSDVSQRNITLDVHIEGGPVFDALNKTEYTFNVSEGNSVEAGNMKFFLLSNNGQRMSSKTKLSFSVSNPAGVTVKIANIRIYKVSEAEIETFLDEDDDVNEEEDDWI